VQRSARLDRGASLAALGAVLALAATLRIVGAGSGLPLPLLNPDETSIVPRAWELADRVGLDPGWYDYPSLLFLLLAPTQLGLDEPSYATARVVAVALGLLGVAAAWWLARVAVGTLAGIAAAVVVAVATTHVAYSRMAVTDVLLTLGVTVCLALLVTDRLEWAGIAAGLAASAKYPGALLLVPLLVAGWGRWRRTAVSAALALAGFALTSPFVLVHADRAWDDFRRVQSLAEDGWLGFEDDPVAPAAYALRMWDTVGPVALVALAGLGVAVWRRRRSDLILLSFAAVYGASLLTSNAHFDRYVLPLVPVVAVLAARTPALAVATLVAALVPLWWSIDDARSLTGRDPRLDAAAWIDHTIPLNESVAADSSTLPLHGRDVLRLQLPGPGRAFDPDRSLEGLRARGIRWLVLGGSVADRVLAAADEYPREAAVYGEVGRLRPVYATPADDGGRPRPWLRVYRIYP
jgi:4-amino-4-deoxy-L-arabinose transferase-like glycosyltransferase